jgi:hypothetical protein
MRVEIDGVDTPLFVNTLSAENAIGQRSTGSVMLRDDAAAKHYEDGQRVDIFDDAQGDLLVFSGVLYDDNEDAITQARPASGLKHKVTLKDWHYLADKRLVGRSYNPGQRTGDIISSVVADPLAEEGVIGTTALPIFTRTSTAYRDNDGVQVTSGNPRYEPGAISGSKAVRVEEGTTNLFTANQSSVETDLTGITIDSTATVTRDPTQHWSGTASAKAVCPGTNVNEGITALVLSGSFVASGKYATSVWILGTAGVTLNVSVKRNDTFNIKANTDVVLTGVWQRVKLTWTADSSLPDGAHGYNIQVDTKFVTATTFWVDGLQVEAKPYATTWQIGGTPRNIETLKVPAYGCLRPDMGTIQWRAYIGPEQRQQVAGSSRHLIGIDKVGGGGALFLYHSDNTAKWVMGINSTQFPQCDDSFTPDGWHKFAVAWDKASVILYIDGVARITHNNPTFAAAFQTYLYIGGDGGGFAQMNTISQDVRLSSRKRTAAEIAADAALSTFLPFDEWTSYLAPLNNSLSVTTSIDAGPLLPAVVLNFCTCAEAFDALAKKAGPYWWEIDEYRLLHFRQYAAVAAPWSLTADVNGLVVDAKQGSVKVRRAKPMYRNRQYIRGITGETDPQIEVKKGDGSATAFTVGYPIAHAPTVEVKIGAGAYTAKTVGIKGVDSAKDWYWNGGDSVITQDSGGVVLTSSDLLRITYVGQFPLMIISEDGAEIVAQQTLEGGYTSGKVESIIEDTSLTSSDAAFTEASALLGKFAKKATQLRFMTKRAGLAPGQLLHVTIPVHQLNDDMLIESVKISDQDGQIIWYDVTALLGPINTSWVQFFAGIARAAQAGKDTLTVGAATTLVIPVSFTAAATPTASFTATVYACPLFPCTFPLTLC